MKRIAAIAAFLIGLQSQSQAANFKISFSWCGDRGSLPKIQLNDVPKGTATLDIWMNDLDRPNARHGGGKIEFKNQKQTGCDITLGNYTGPYPPPNESHTYEIEVKALDKDGNKLSSAKATKKFPEK